MNDRSKERRESYAFYNQNGLKFKFVFFKNKLYPFLFLKHEINSTLCFEI